MTCKDCLYQKTCHFEAHYLDRKTWGKYKDGVEKSCPDFQNKTDFVKVVRCKDCKAAKSLIFFDGFYFCRKYRVCRNEDDFCSRGKRRDS